MGGRFRVTRGRSTIMSDMRHVRALVDGIWLLLAGAAVLLAGMNLAGAIADAHYDPHENRAPAAIVVMAVLAAILSVLAPRAAIRWHRRSLDRAPAGGGIALTVAAYFALFLAALVELASGPL